jgi:hypothetical protein
MRFVTINQYVNWFELGVAGMKPFQGICGRVLKGKSKEDFEVFSPDKERRIVLLLDAEGLRGLLGLTGWEILMRIGHGKERVLDRMSEGVTYKLAVFPSRIMQIGTWDQMLDMVAEAYPRAEDIVDAQRAALKSTPYAAIEKMAIEPFFVSNRVGEVSPLFMTEDRLLQTDGSLTAVRAFLYHTLHLYELYSGDGWTYDSEGTRGAQEFMAPNRRLSQMGTHRLIDLEVTTPETE